jgi:GDP-L-fucose synthase
LKAFIAGHNGLVGSALVRNAPASFEILTAGRTELPLQDSNEVSKFLEIHKPDLIVLAAGRVGGIGANSSHQKDFLVENLTIQNNVITAASKVGVPNLIFLGSSCIYPRLAPQPIQEESLMTGPLEPTNEGYALAKIAGIRLCKAIFEEEGLNYFSLMPTNLYGPHDNFDLKSSHLPAALMRRFHEAKVKGSKMVEIWGTGTPRREFMHSDDLANACWFMSDKQAGGDLLNVGTGIDLRISEFAQLMANVVGYQGKMTYDTARPDGAPQKILDVSKMKSLGWSSKIKLADGLQETYSWFEGELEKGGVRGY